MTTKPKPTTSAAAPTPDGIETAEPLGTIRLKLAPLGIDHRADDFPTRFIEFCEQNDLYQMEVNAQGELLILPMTGAHGSRQEGYAYTFLCNWEIAHFGVAYPQTVRFRLSNGATLGPDAAWMTRERYDALPSEQRVRIIEGVPDFIVEIRSRTDDLRLLDGWPAAPASAG
jgi:Uma2 family endonuclease